MAIIASILDTTKVLVGIAPDETHFDDIITVHINTALMALNQLGIGPLTGFSITGSAETWNDYLGETFANVEAVKNYIFIVTKLAFDPPTSSYVVDVMERTLREIEWRLRHQVESKLLVEPSSEV